MNTIPLNQHWGNLKGSSLEQTKAWVYEAVKDAMDQDLNACDLDIDRIPCEQRQPLIRWLQSEHKLKCCLKNVAKEENNKQSVTMVRTLYVHW